MNPRSIGRILPALLIATACAVVLSTPPGRDAALLAVVAAYALSAGVVWLVGIRSLALWAHSRRVARCAAVPDAGAPSTDAPELRVALLYCTADDFDADALRASMRQSLAADTLILDDSSDPVARRRIDAFAAEHLAAVMRRPDRTGFKAGNLNNALAVLRGRYDAFVVLDSDTRLPRGFAAAAAAVLAADSGIACVQGVPDAGGRSGFARLFGPNVRAHAIANHVPRGRHGFPLFCGRGAMLSAHALDAVGGFPETVAEDLALSERLRAAGWRIVHRPDLVFAEAYPVDYAAFRTQAAKTAEGVAQFLRTARRDGARLPLRERVDAVAEAALLPAGAVAGIALGFGGGLLGALGHPVPTAVIALTALLALAPLFPGAVLHARRSGPVAGALFVVAASALYASVAVLTVRHAWAVARGRRAVFAVTPKTGRRLRGREALAVLRFDIAYALVAGAVAVIAGIPVLALPLALPVVAGIVLLLIGPAEAVAIAAPAQNAAHRGIRPPLPLRARRALTAPLS